MPQQRLSKAEHLVGLWFVAMLTCVTVMFLCVNIVFAAGWVTVLLVGILAISWLPMNVLAAVLERRTLLNPREQFWQFYIGDLLFLPGAMACMAALQSNLGGKPWQPGWWTVVCVLVAVGAGCTFHWVVDAPKSNGYSVGQWRSPTKMWHDLYVIPVFLFYLAIKLPLLWSSVAWKGTTGWTLSVLTLIFVASWATLMLADGARKPSPLATAHVNFDWAHLRPVRV